MQAARKKSVSIPARRRCYACQQKHIKCSYEKDDEKCKSCRANDRKCVVKHRFQQVNPALKRPKKRTGSKNSKTSNRSGEDEDEAISETSGFAVFDWAPQTQSFASPPPPPTSEPRESSGQIEKDQEQNDVSTDSGSDRPTQESHPTEDEMEITALPAVSHSDQTSIHVELTYNHNEKQQPSPLVPLPYLSPNFDHISNSPVLPRAVFSPSAFSASGIPHASPLSAVASIPTPGEGVLAEKEKAFLLRHFTDVLWKWFDLCDPDQHFRRIVPVRALKCATLMKAICASSAWHLCRKGKYDSERTNYLYEDCLSHLIKAMDDPEVGSNDSILIAATILHNVEELRDLEHTLVLESRGHLAGINIFLDSRAASWERNSLRQAALRVAVREELHTCFINQQPLTLPAELSGIDRSFSPASDEIWAWRVLLIYRDALANSLSPSTTADWDRIYNDLQSWYNLKPCSFEPTFYSAPDMTTSSSSGRVLPEIWFLHDSHIIGMMYYHISLIVLATSNPRTPKIGWNRSHALRRVDDEVRENVVIVAGIAMSNHLLPSAMTAASMVVTMCAESVVGNGGGGGGKESDSTLQQALYDVLLKAKETHGWPTEAAQKYVRSVWYDKGEVNHRSAMAVGGGTTGSIEIGTGRSGNGVTTSDTADRRIEG